MLVDAKQLDVAAIVLNVGPDLVEAFFDLLLFHDDVLRILLCFGRRLVLRLLFDRRRVVFSISVSLFSSAIITSYAINKGSRIIGTMSPTPNPPTTSTLLCPKIVLSFS